MPNITILSPANKRQLEHMLEYAVNECNGPVAIRYPRGNTECSLCGNNTAYNHLEPIHYGERVAIVATGRMMATANAVAEAVGKNITVCAMPCIKPFPTDDIKELASRNELIVTIEDGVKTGGIGEMISTCVLENGINSKIKIFAFPTEPIIHGSVSELDAKYGVDVNTIKNYILDYYGKN